MFTSLVHFWKKLSGRYAKYFLFLFLFVGGSCFAAQKDSDVVNAIIQVLDLVFAFLSFLMTPAIIIAGWLLTPDWTMGDFFGLRKYFIDVWVLVSNIVYIIFALLLLVMAVVQIFGGGEAEYAFKQKLPKFLLGVLVVPFTWLIVSWTLSFVNQATAAVLSIPMGAIASIGNDSADANGDKGIFHEKIIPTEIELNFSDSGANDPTKICESITTASDTRCISAAEFVKYNGSGPFFIIMIYAYNIFKIQNTSIVSLADACEPQADGSVADSSTCIKNLTSILRQFGLALIVSFFFSVLLVALCWVLLMRAFKLWIYVMFSPLFGLAIFTGEGLTGALHSEGGGDHGGGSGLSSVGFVPFFKLAFVPVLVSAVLSFGLLFVGVISSTFSSTLLNGDKGGSGEICTTGDFMVKYCIKEDDSQNGKTNEQGYSSWLVIGTNTSTDNGGKADGTAGDYTIVFKFDAMFSGFVGNAKTQGGSIAAGTVSSVESIFAHIILTLISLVIIWMGVKAAVSYDEVTRIAFEPFAKFGDSVQHMVAHLPSHIPLPHPAFAALTPDGMEAMANSIRQSVDNSKFERQKSLKEKFSSPGLIDLEAAAQGGASSLKQFNDKLAETSIRDRDSLTGVSAQKLQLTNIVEGSNIANKQTVINQIKDANSTSDLAKVIDDHKLTEKITEPEQQRTFQIIKQGAQQSASSGSSSGEKPFNTTVNSNGEVPIGQGAPLNADSINAQQIKDRGLSGTQKEKIRTLKTELENDDNGGRNRREALTKLGITVDAAAGEQKRLEREKKIATALVGSIN